MYVCIYNDNIRIMIIKSPWQLRVPNVSLTIRSYNPSLLVCLLDSIQCPLRAVVYVPTPPHKEDVTQDQFTNWA